jgi:PUA-domain protein
MKQIVPKKRHILRRGDATSVYERLSGEIGGSAALFHAEQPEILETNGEIIIYLVERKPYLVAFDGFVFPTLKGAVERPFPERRVVVDMGAVPYVIKGADIMRPGVISCAPDVKAGHPVQIVDERHGKPLGIGIAVMDAADLMAQTGGKVVKSRFHVGDELWNLELG